jgi:hypothetical protein
MAIFLYDKATDRRLFEITSAQRDQLVEALEEESSTDHDYYIDAAVCDFLEGRLDGLILSRLRELIGAAPLPEGLEAAGDGDDPPPVEEPEEDRGLEIEWREEG